MLLMNDTKQDACTQRQTIFWHTMQKHKTAVMHIRLMHVVIHYILQLLLILKAAGLSTRGSSTRGVAEVEMILIDSCSVSSHSQQRIREKNHRCDLHDKIVVRPCCYQKTAHAGCRSLASLFIAAAAAAERCMCKLQGKQQSSD
jgi:hypothetical protein